MRVAFIGLGKWGTNLLRVFSRLENVEVTTLCDIRSEALRAAAPARQYETTVDPVDLLRRLDTNAVVIATPPGTHFHLAMLCLRSGKHVFVEKPMALSYGEARALHHDASARDLRIVVGHVLHYHDTVRVLTRCARRGLLGSIRSIVTERYGGVRAVEGPWWSLAPHDVSVMRSLHGDEPLSVLAHRTSAGLIGARLRFADGARGHISVGFATSCKRRRIAVIGTRRLALFDDLEPDRKLLFYPAPDRPFDCPAEVDQWIGRVSPTEVVRRPRTEPLQNEARRFIAHIRARRAMPTDSYEGCRVVAALEAGAESLALGTEVPVKFDD